MTFSGAAFTAAGVLAVAGAGAGAGAGLYAAFSPGDTTTVNAVTTVERAQPAASTAGLTINDIYQRSNQGVVDITVRTSGGSQLGQFGGSQSGQAEGSGFVYDTRGTSSRTSTSSTARRRSPSRWRTARATRRTWSAATTRPTSR